MLSQHMCPLVKIMVKRNIRCDNILTLVFARLENSRSFPYASQNYRKFLVQNLIFIKM